MEFTDKCLKHADNFEGFAKRHEARGDGSFTKWRQSSRINIFRIWIGRSGLRRSVWVTGLQHYRNLQFFWPGDRIIVATTMPQARGQLRGVRQEARGEGRRQVRRRILEDVTQVQDACIRDAVLRSGAKRKSGKVQDGLVSGAGSRSTCATACCSS